MKVTLVMVISANGKTTRGDESPNLWASAEDQAHFEKLKSRAQVIVMGRKTYDQAKAHIEDGGKKRVVMSRATHSPKGVIAELEKQGYFEMLLVGGSELNADFFKEELIDEIYLTIEPAIFGSGLPLIQGQVPETRLELISWRQLNDRGTLLLHYRVL